MEELIKEIENLLSSNPDSFHYSKQEIQPISKIIAEDSRFDIFFNHCHKLGAASGTFFKGELDFPNQIIQRAKDIGTENTIKEILDYLNADEIHIKYAYLLYGIHIDTEYTFSNNVSLINTSSLDDSRMKDFLYNSSTLTGGHNTALLITDYITHKEYYDNHNPRQTDWTKVEVLEELIQKLDDTRLMLSLGRDYHYGIPVSAAFEVVPDHLHFFNRATPYNPFPEPRTTLGPQVIELELNKTEELLTKFNSLSFKDKEGIRVATKRLNDSKIDPNWANKSINLRICLENLFYDRNSNGIAKTISERAPQYTNFSKSRTRKIYQFLSAAVHTGVPQTHATITEVEIIEELHNTIIAYINLGAYPVWENINLQRSKWKKFMLCIKSLFSSG